MVAELVTELIRCNKDNFKLLILMPPPPTTEHL